MTFEMPQANVLVTAVFEEKNSQNIKVESCDANEHSYSEVVTPPTCVHKGYTTYVCSVCGDSYTDNEVETLAHSCTEEIIKEATETEDGLKTFTCSCGFSYDEKIPAIKKDVDVKNNTDNSQDEALTKNPSSDPIVVNDTEGTTPANVYIRELSTELFYGAENTADGYVWTAEKPDKDHRFSFRINYAISGEDVAPVNSIQFKIPKSILINRNGESADYYEMSIPSKTEIDAFLDGTGESIDNDVNWGYFEEGNNILIYNFREIEAGNNGYIEMSYITSETTFNYIDMVESNGFVCTMTASLVSTGGEGIIKIIMLGIILGAVAGGCVYLGKKKSKEINEE